MLKTEYDSCYNLLTVEAPKETHYLTEHSEMCKAMLPLVLLAFVVVDGRAELVEPNVANAFRARFENVKTVNNMRWMVAPALKPFGNHRFPDLTFVKKNGKTVIHKAAYNSSYHVCLGIPVRPGIKIAIKFSAVYPDAAESSPLPMFGIRSASGREKVLRLLRVSPPMEYELYLEADHDRVTLLYVDHDKKTFLKTFGPREFGSRGMPQPVFPYFHMNNRSGVVIHSIRSDYMQSNVSSESERSSEKRRGVTHP